MYPWIGLVIGPVGPPQPSDLDVEPSRESNTWFRNGTENGPAGYCAVARELSSELAGFAGFSRKKPPVAG